MSRFIFLYIIFFSFCYLSPDLSDSTKITESQKEKISQLTKDIFMAPDFELKSVKDKVYKLSDFKGKVVILNFWATWCGPCRMEIPDFNELYNENKELVILGISTDDTKKGLINFLKTYKIDYPILYGAPREISKISSDYGGIMALPTSVIISKKGEIKRIYPTAILKKYTPQIYSDFIQDVQSELKAEIEIKTHY